MTRILYIGLLSARYSRSTKGGYSSHIVRGHIAPIHCGGAQNCASPFIHESCDRNVYVIGSEARRTGKHLLD